MFERAKTGERVILVHIDFQFQTSGDLAECAVLAESAGATVVETITGRRQQADPKFFVGSGKAKEIAERVSAKEIDVVIIDHALSPAQERNLEKMFCCRVLSRTGLILDIFASRARTHEGKLQVELAQLQYLSTRLVRGWTHLERQKGGIGLRGPGETQLESDRRLVRDRIKSIKARLLKVREQRQQSRGARKRSALPTVALVGYTNAGKSSLFNVLSQADIYVADKLFATLDPTLRKIHVPHFGHIILADTVGFIRHLPHDLVEAFSATLEEVKDADLLLHVVDISAEDHREKMAAVQKVLAQIGAARVPQLNVFNKIDLCRQAPHVDCDGKERPQNVWLSVAKKTGFNLLENALLERLSDEVVHCCFRLSPSESALRAGFYEQGAVLDETIADNGDCLIEVRLPKASSGLLDEQNLQSS